MTTSSSAAVRRLRVAAERAVEAGFFVFPVRPRAKTPVIPGWEQAATRDLRQVGRWWRTTPFNVGLAVGRSGVVVIDLDQPKLGPSAVSGVEALGGLADERGQVVPVTASVTTPSTGRHLYCRMPHETALRNSQGLLAPLIDTRGVGGYVLAAGSVLPSGRYVARGGEIAELPGWLATLLTPPPLPPAARTPESELRLRGSRATAYVNAIVASETEAVAAAVVGTRHTTRLRAARTLGRLVGGGELDAARARWVLLEAAEAHLGADTSVREIERDIDDGLAFGARMPRRIRQAVP
ncbi:bifunctional DNA primase/polymerase [Pseudonocardia xishanensis]|uniref:DNA primase/polymerase bifunctional N-terminal domain-containing protein n=1 Tax=Pseudonocardia xishanensis TaxID=630995 RepID=A0ABP8S186_9PSEU